MTATLSAPPRGTQALGPVAVGREDSIRVAVAAALLAGLVLRIAIGLTDDAPSTDETAYLRSGISLVDGDGYARGDRPELHFPPLVPFLLGLASKVFPDPHTGTVVLTGLSATLIVVPLALLARRLAGRTAAVTTAWVAAFAPALATTPAARGAGTEMEYALLVVTAVWLVVVAADRHGRARLAAAGGAGLMIGLSYLTRPEGLLLAVPLGAAVILAALRRPDAGLYLDPESDLGSDPDSEPRPGQAALWRRWRGIALAAGRQTSPDAGRVSSARWRGAALAGAAFLVPLVVCIVPYARFLHTHTGQWQLTAKTQDVSLEAWAAVARGDREDRDRVLYALDESGLELPTEHASLPSLARDDPAGYAGIVGSNVRALGRNLSGWWLLPLPVWLVAAWAAWRRRASSQAQLVLAVSALPVATSLIFFVQPRYLVVTAALATVLVGAAVPLLSIRMRRLVVPALFALLVGASIGAFYGDGGWWHPGDHTDHRQAGEWIAAHTDPDDVVMTRSFVVDYYAERPTLAIPYADMDQVLRFGRHYGAQYLVADDFLVGRYRPQLADLFEHDQLPGLRLVHEVRTEGRITRVFALDPAPPPSSETGPSLGFMGDGSG